MAPPKEMGEQWNEARERPGIPNCATVASLQPRALEPPASPAGVIGRDPAQDQDFQSPPL